MVKIPAFETDETDVTFDMEMKASDPALESSENSDNKNLKVDGNVNLAVELFAFLCKEFKLDPLEDGIIISHKEGSDRGIASALIAKFVARLKSLIKLDDINSESFLHGCRGRVKGITKIGICEDFTLRRGVFCVIRNYGNYSEPPFAKSLLRSFPLLLCSSFAHVWLLAI